MKSDRTDYFRKWYQRNKKRKAATARAWRKRNKERHAANAHAWYIRNKERKLATARAWVARNRRQRLAYQRAWNKRNKERMAIASHAGYERDKKYWNIRVRTWRQANTETSKAIAHARRARELSAAGRFTKNDINALWSKQRGVCAAPHCNTSLTVSCTIDHKQPLSRGGSNWPSNLQLLCSSCNSTKSTKTMNEWLDISTGRVLP